MTFDELALFDARESFVGTLPCRIKYYAPYESCMVLGEDYVDEGDLEGYVIRGYVNTDFSDLRNGDFTAYFDDGTPVKMAFVTTDVDKGVPGGVSPAYYALESDEILKMFLDGRLSYCYVFTRTDAGSDRYIHYCEACDTYMLVDEDDCQYYGDNVDAYICGNCRSEGRIECCDDCGTWFWDNGDILYCETLGRTVCDDCLTQRDRYYRCNDCEEWFYTEGDDDHYIESEGYSVCSSCLDDYWRCECCEEWFYDNTESHNNVSHEIHSSFWYCDECVRQNAVWSDIHNTYISNNFRGGAIKVIDGWGEEDWCFDRGLLCNEYVITNDHKLVHYTQAVWVYEEEEYVLRSEAGDLLCDSDYDDASPRITMSSLDFLFDWTREHHPENVIGSWATAADRRAREEQERLRREEEARRPRIYGYHSYADHWVKHYTPADMFRYREQIAQGLSERDVANKLLYIGWELEIDGAGENAEKALAITTALGYPCNESDEFKCSHDGSLSNGFEIISMPCTLSHHTKVYKLKEGLAKARALGYVSHDAPPGRSHGTCGLHFHVNRNFFWDEHGSCNTISYDGSTIPDYKLKLTLLVHNNKEWLLPFSRRGETRYCNFAIDANIGNNKLYANDFTRDVDEDDGAIDGSGRGLKALVYMANSYGGHGSALNFSNPNTVEFRFCRGTLNYTTFVASLQYVQMTCEIVKSFDIKQLCSVDLDFYMKLAEKRGYNEFIKYMNKRMARVEVSVDSVAA